MSPLQRLRQLAVLAPQYRKYLAALAGAAGTVLLVLQELVDLNLLTGKPLAVTVAVISVLTAAGVKRSKNDLPDPIAAVLPDEALNLLDEFIAPDQARPRPHP